MRDPQKSTLVLNPGVSDLKRAAVERQFDLAAVDFYLRYSQVLDGLSLRAFMSRFERAIVFETLVRTHGSQKETASLLGVKKQTLSWKVKKQQIRITKQVVRLPD